VADLIPAQIGVGGLQRVLQALLAERVSIRDLPTILEGLQEGAGAGQRSIPALLALVRARLARQLSDAARGPQGYVPLIALSADWEQAFAEALAGPPEERQLAMAPALLQQFMQPLRESFDAATTAGEAPVLVCSGTIRGHVRAIVERFRPATTVLSQAEIHPHGRQPVNGAADRQGRPVASWPILPSPDRVAAAATACRGDRLAEPAPELHCRPNSPTWNCRAVPGMAILP